MAEENTLKLIDAEKLAYNVNSYRKGNSSEADRAFNEGLDVALRWIKQAKPVEVKKTAVWLQRNGHFACSNCRSMSTYMVNYCYYCGAYMTEG